MYLDGCSKMKKVHLKQLIDAIEMASDEWDQYLDIETMTIVNLPQFDDDIDTDYESLANRIEADINDRYFRLPSKFDIHEYSIMERFIYDLPYGSTRDELAGCIHGKGAFRRFKDSLRYHGIEQAWYDYRNNAYREIAIEWCESNRFAYFEESAEKTT